MINPELTAAFDISQIDKWSKQKWRLGPRAVPISDVDDQDPLYPVITKVLRATSIIDYGSVLGGLCSIYTGDLDQDRGYPKEAIQVVRLDQIVEAIGTTQVGKPVIVVEDSFFNRLTTIPVDTIRSQGDLAANYIQRWLQASCPSGNYNQLTVVKISDKGVEAGLQDAVCEVAREIQNNTFKNLVSAPILLMYTSYWPELLASLGYLDSPNAMIVEPVNHFVDDRSFPSWPLEKAYLDFINWLAANPQGIPGSRNQNVGIAGYLDSYVNGKRTRLLTYDQVPNNTNFRIWLQTLRQTISWDPFPLRNSLLFTEGVNWGLGNPQINPLLKTLAQLETAYYRKRKSTPKEQRSEKWATDLREEYRQQAQPSFEKLYDKLDSLISTVFGGN